MAVCAEKSGTRPEIRRKDIAVTQRVAFEGDGPELERIGRTVRIVTYLARDRGHAIGRGIPGSGDAGRIFVMIEEVQES